MQLSDEGNSARAGVKSDINQGDIVKVRFQLAQPLDIGNDGVELTLYRPNGALVGKLTIGRATVKWKKRNARSESEIKTERLVELIEQDIAAKKPRVRASSKRQPLQLAQTVTALSYLNTHRSRIHSGKASDNRKALGPCLHSGKAVANGSHAPPRLSAPSRRYGRRPGRDRMRARNADQDARRGRWHSHIPMG